MINITPQIAVLADAVLDSVVCDATVRSFGPVASPPSCSPSNAWIGGRPRVGSSHASPPSDPVLSARHGAPQDRA